MSKMTWKQFKELVLRVQAPDNAIIRISVGTLDRRVVEAVGEDNIEILTPCADPGFNIVIISSNHP